MRKKKLAWRFARLANWKSRQDLTDQLIKNIVYQNDGDKSGLIGKQGYLFLNILRFCVVSMASW